MSDNISRQRRLSRLLSGDQGLNITNFDWDPDIDGDDTPDWQGDKPDVSLFNNDAEYVAATSLVAGSGITISTPTQDDPGYTFATVVYELDTNSGMTLSAETSEDRSGVTTRLRKLKLNSNLSGVVSSIGSSANNRIVSTDDKVCFMFANGDSAQEQFRVDKSGNIHANADVIAYSSTIPSDPRLKTELQPIEGALGRVGQLTGYTYHYINGRASAGVLSSDVKKVLPSAVTQRALPLMDKGEVEYETVDYAQLHGLMIEAVKELSQQMDRLTARVKELEDVVQ